MKHWRWTGRGRLTILADHRPGAQQMQLFGHRTRVITYMMGNNVIVERMFRHDPGVMLYAPLRTAIYQEPDDRAI